MKTMKTVLSRLLPVLVCCQLLHAQGDEPPPGPSTDSLREAAKGGDPAAQYQLANRLLDGKARSPQAQRIISEAEAELQLLVRRLQFDDHAAERPEFQEGKKK